MRYGHPNFTLDHSFRVTTVCLVRRFVAVVYIYISESIDLIESPFFKELTALPDISPVIDVHYSTKKKDYLHKVRYIPSSRKL